LCHARLLELRSTSGAVGMGDGDGVLERIEFEVVEDGYVLLASLARLERDFLNSGGGGSGNGSEDDDGGDGREDHHCLVIIDSASGALSPLLYGENDGGAGSAVMNEVLVVLRRLARCTVWTSDGNDFRGKTKKKRRIAVLVTNGVVSAKNIGGGRQRGAQRYRPALGDSWRVADVRLQMEVYGDVYGRNEDNSGGCAVPGLVRSTMRRVNAQLERHYAKACYRSQHQRQCQGGQMGRREEEGRCEFGIQVCGIVDSDGSVVLR